MSKSRKKITHKERKWFAHIAFNFTAQSFFTKCTQCLFQLTILFMGTASAQDLRFTQFHASDTWLNPAFAGIKGQPRIEVNVRDQWPSMPQSYMSYRVAFDAPLAFMSSGAGLFIVKDDQGQSLLQSLQVGGQFNYQVQLGKKLAFNGGIQASYTQYKINWAEVQLFDQINPVYGFTDASGNPNPSGQAMPAELELHYPDFSAGFLFFSSKWYAGGAVSHLTQPEQNFFSNENSRLPMAVTAQAGFQILKDYKTDPFVTNPVVVATMQKDFRQLMAGSYFRKSKIIAGVFAKYNFSELTDVSALAGLKKGWMTFAYSYDIALGSLQGQSGGAHEISIVVLFEQSSTKTATIRRKHALDCPGVL